MKPKVQIKCDSYNSNKVEVIIDGHKIPSSKILSLDVSFRPDEVVTAIVELLVDETDIRKVSLEKHSSNNQLPPPNKPNEICTGFFSSLRRK